MQPAVRERAGLLFSSLSNPTRLRIVELLCTEEKTVNEVAVELHLSQSGASQHLANLTRAGVLSMEARGTSHRYKVRGPRIPRILELIEQFCEAHALYGTPEGDQEIKNSNAEQEILCAEAEDLGSARNAQSFLRKERSQEKMREKNEIG